MSTFTAPFLDERGGVWPMIFTNDQINIWDGNSFSGGTYGEIDNISTFIIHYDGSKAWYQNELLHNLKGPAVIYSNGDKFWFIKDELLKRNLNYTLHLGKPRMVY